MECYLKEATIEDIDILYKWANDPLVRQNSFSTEKIRYEDHVKWFNRVLKEDNYAQYIYMDGENPIGQVHVKIENDVAEIGYSICAEKLRMGYGSDLVSQISREIWKKFPDVTKIIGKVKSENIASQKTLLDAGYKEMYRVFEIKG